MRGIQAWLKVSEGRHACHAHVAECNGGGGSLVMHR
jgi:hypothetical protein